jgi:hypothetical protein
MFGFLKSSETLEKELRAWFLEDELRVRGDTEPERQEIREYVAGKELRYLVEDVATDLLNKEQEAPMEAKLFGMKVSASEAAHRKRGLHLLKAFLKAKAWTIERDREGYYKLKTPVA